MNQLLSDRAITAITVIWLIACIVFGGASGAGVIANAGLEIGAIVIILAVIWFFPPQKLAQGEGALFILAALLAGYIVLTAIPMPAAYWSRLPGRQAIANGYHLLNMPLPPLPIALAPDRFLRSVLSFLPPVATYLLARRVTESHQQVLVLTIVVAAIGSILLGAAQLLGGPDSPLRFYEFTNRNAPVGFFANANHLATLLLVAQPCAALIARRWRRGDSARWSLIGFIVLEAILALGLVLDRSLAGIGLLPLVLVGSIVVYATSKPLRHRKAATIAIVISVLAISVASFALLSSQSLQAKFRDTPGSRSLATPTTLAAARDFMPFGSGLGSYVQIYGGYEPARYVTDQYMNHAHNDYAEAALELGAPGVILIACFMLWFAVLGFRAWIDPAQSNTTARVASVIIALIIAHSAVDYPLRTSAIAVIFALACALLLSRTQSWMTGLSFATRAPR